MHTQHVADRPSHEHCFAALESHKLSTDLSTYPHPPHLGIIETGGACAPLKSIAGKMAGFTTEPRTTSDRRYRCRRTSNFSQCSALWSPLLPVRASSRSKNLSWLIQNRSAKSLCTQASTSKSQTGWASAPVLTFTAPKLHLKPSTAEGVAWH